MYYAMWSHIRRIIVHILYIHIFWRRKFNNNLVHVVNGIGYRDFFLLPRPTIAPYMIINYNIVSMYEIPRGAIFKIGLLNLKVD